MATATVKSGFTDDWQGERTLAECNLHMLKSADTCDVTLLVGKSEDIVRAYRYILISRSCVFNSMLCGSLSEGHTVTIPDVSKEFFTEFLTFLYTDDCSLTADNVTGILYLSKKYAVHRFHRLCLSFLQTNLTPVIACVVLEQAHFFDEEELFQQALTIVTTNGNVTLLTPSFCDLCHSCFEKVLISSDLDHFTKPEVMFHGVISWASAECSRQGKEISPRNQRDVLGETVYQIGFTGFDAASFVEKVEPSKLLDDSECLQIMKNIACPDKDAGLFRIVCKIVVCDLEIYQEQRIPDTKEQELFNEKFVGDSVQLKCDQTTLLHGITFTPCEANFEVTVSHEDKTTLKTSFKATLTETKLIFPSRVRLESGMTYCIDAKQKGMTCPLLLTNMKEEIPIGKSSFHISRNPNAEFTARGLIMKLKVS